jgi:hypothetical protein
MAFVSRILLLLCLVAALPVPASASGWRFRSGEELPGAPVAFDSGRKTLTFRDPISGHESVVPTRNLSLRSKQRLLLSPLVHGEEGEAGSWSEEKGRVLLLFISVPALLLFFGFWGAAGYFTRRWHPFPAIAGFVGGWAVVGILAICYAFLARRLEGGAGLLVFGGFVALGIAALYVSAVYVCSYGRALMVLFSHLLAGFCLLSIGLAVFEIGAGKKRSEQWWDERVFEPFGIIVPETPRRGP